MLGPLPLYWVWELAWDNWIFSSEHLSQCLRHSICSASWVRFRWPTDQRLLKNQKGSEDSPATQHSKVFLFQTRELLEYCDWVRSFYKNHVVKSFSCFRSWKPLDLVPKETHIAHWSLLYSYTLSMCDAEPNEVFGLSREVTLTSNFPNYLKVPGTALLQVFTRERKEFDVISVHARRDCIHLLRPGSLWLEAGGREKEGRAWRHGGNIFFSFWSVVPLNKLVSGLCNSQ